MEKMIKVLGIILFSAFILLPLKTTAQEPEWSQDLDLNNSVSSAIAKVEDGVVVMQYEGVACVSNLLIKYDFNGNKIWEISNDYGYNIESVSDGFIVWSETKITKFDKDKNIIWSKDIQLQPTDANDAYSYIGDTAGLGGKLVELDDYYIIYEVHFVANSRRDIFIFDKKGNIFQRMSINDFLKKNNISSNDFWIYSIAYLYNNKFIMMYQTCPPYSSMPIHVAEITSDLTIVNDTEYLLSAKNTFFTDYGVDVIKIIPTDRGYISFGSHVACFLSSDNIDFYDKLVLDVIKKDDYIYTYELREKSFQDNNDSMIYDTYIVQYDMNMEEKKSIQLPLSLGAVSTVSGLAQLKNRFILGNENKIVVLNTPMRYGIPYAGYSNYSDIYEMQQGYYSLSSYRFLDDETPSTDDNNSTISGVINNIFKNPQTNSIIIIIVFVVLMLAILIASYFVYQRKIKKQ